MPDSVRKGKGPLARDAKLRDTEIRKFTSSNEDLRTEGHGRLRTEGRGGDELHIFQ